MEYDINNIIKSSYLQLSHLGKIRKYSTIEATEKLVHAFITSRLDNLDALSVILTSHRLGGSG